MHSLVRTVFSRLKDIEAEGAENQLARDEETEKARAESAGTNQATEDLVGPTSIAGTAVPPDITVSSTPTPSSSPRE
jgi:hypothetical protein